MSCHGCCITTFAQMLIYHLFKNGIIEVIRHPIVIQGKLKNHSGVSRVRHRVNVGTEPDFFKAVI